MSERALVQSTQRSTAPPSQSVRVQPQLQRKCACGGTPGPTGECEACRRRRMSLQREKGRAAAPAIVNEVLRSPGQPLRAEERAALGALWS